MEPESLLIRPAAPDPIYRQIVEQVRRLVASGKLAPGEAMPSVRDVAGYHAVNPMTVSRAYSLLETEGLLERLRGRGMVVAAGRRRPLSDDRRLEQIAPRLQELAREARELGLSAQTILEQLKELLEKKS